MRVIRKADERGAFDHGWLDTRHTFSFAGYRDPRHMGFRALRVINEDVIAPGHGFGTHGHEDMEIVTCVLSGALEHRDSMGNGAVLRRGEFQHMSAGTGIEHSEFNPSDTEPCHLYQIWLKPSVRGVEPSYSQREFLDEERRGKWRVVASPDGREGSLKIVQDAQIFLSLLEDDEQVVYNMAPGRHAWLQVLAGNVTLDHEPLTAGDGVAISDELETLVVQSAGPSELMLFDLP